MFSVRLCAAAGQERGFSLQRARSGRERLDIISAAHVKLRPVGVSDPTASRPSVDVGVEAVLVAPAPTRQGFPSRAASSHAPQRWSIHSWLPRRPRAWQALACRAIMRRPHRVDLALSSGDVAGAGPAAHNRTLHIEAGLGRRSTSHMLLPGRPGALRRRAPLRTRTCGFHRIRLKQALMARRRCAVPDPCLCGSRRVRDGRQPRPTCQGSALRSCRG